uniref:alpha/beta hydrolase n=1 Tax=Vaginimicrobium propionicum TaxID=1871034 RepID=UPI000970C3A1|nr:alpha/beta hydrolase [Vaginimicrobium propionicum]
MKWLKILIAIVVVVAIVVGVFAYRNLHYDYGNDRFLESKGKSLGFEEKIYKTVDGSEISYFEGPNNGEPLMLIHGQMVSKDDYAKVFPELSKHFHIFAVDCYGHGNSSKDPEKYNIVSIRDDLIDFMNEVIQEKTYLSGHSSGALISAAIAAENKSQVRGLLLEDGPFFSTEPARAEKTLAYLEFETMNDFLTQDSEKNYTRYYLDHTYLRELFNKDGKESWSFLVKNPFQKRIKEGSGKMPLVWYYPPEMGLNGLVFLTRNMQDGTGEYDLRFGQAFYDFSWFEGFDQAEALSRIECPTIILHVAESKETAPSYYNKDGVLLSAMDEEDVAKVKSLIKSSTLKDGYKSGHDIHVDLPKQFVEAALEMEK